MEQNIGSVDNIKHQKGSIQIAEFVEATDKKYRNEKKVKFLSSEV